MANVRRLSCLASVVIALVGCGGGGGGGGGNPAAEVLCDKMVSCGAMPSTARSLCVQSLGMYVPDPAAAKECIEGMNPTCADVTNDTTMRTIATTCMYDTGKFSCASLSTLNMCSPDTSGHPSVCKTLDCPSACDQLFGVGGQCGYEATDGWDKCLCGL